MESLLRRFALPHRLLYVANGLYSLYVVIMSLRYAQMPECRLLGDLPLCVVLLFSTYPVWCLAVYVTYLLVKAYQRYLVGERHLPASVAYRRWRKFNLVVLGAWSVSSWVWAFVWTYAAFALLAA